MDDSKRMFDEHMSMLKEKMAKKAARQEQMRLEREAKRKVAHAQVCFLFGFDHIFVLEFVGGIEFSCNSLS